MTLNLSFSSPEPFHHPPRRGSGSAPGASQFPLTGAISSPGPSAHCPNPLSLEAASTLLGNRVVICSLSPLLAGHSPASRMASPNHSPVTASQPFLSPTMVACPRYHAESYDSSWGIIELGVVLVTPKVDTNKMIAFNNMQNKITYC